MTRLARIEWWGVGFGILIGTTLHFTYAWFGRSPIIGTFSAINESVWEHTKLLVTPIIMYGLVEWRLLGGLPRLIIAKAVELVVTTIFIIAFFYTYTGALGIEEILLIDILSFFVAVMIGKFMSYRLLQSTRSVTASSLMIGALTLVTIVVLQVVFSFTTPDWPLFQEHDTLVSLAR